MAQGLLAVLGSRRGCVRLVSLGLTQQVFLPSPCLSLSLRDLITRAQVRREVDLMRSKHNTVPGLAVIMVGERRDSAKYVSMKQVRARKRGGHKKAGCHIYHRLSMLSRDQKAPPPRTPPILLSSRKMTS